MAVCLLHNTYSWIPVSYSKTRGNDATLRWIYPDSVNLKNTCTSSHADQEDAIFPPRLQRPAVSEERRLQEKHWKHNRSNLHYKYNSNIRVVVFIIETFGKTIHTITILRGIWQKEVFGEKKHSLCQIYPAVRLFFLHLLQYLNQHVPLAAQQKMPHTDISLAAF